MTLLLLLIVLAAIGFFLLKAFASRVRRRKESESEQQRSLATERLERALIESDGEHRASKRVALGAQEDSVSKIS
jgi:cytidylate kinase